MPTKSLGQIAYEAFCAAGRRIASPYDLKDKSEQVMWEEMAQAVAKVEREACANVCDARQDGNMRAQEFAGGSAAAEEAGKCAAAIRARTH